VSPGCIGAAALVACGQRAARIALEGLYYACSPLLPALRWRRARSIRSVNLASIFSRSCCVHCPWSSSPGCGWSPATLDQLASLERCRFLPPPMAHSPARNRVATINPDPGKLKTPGAARRRRRGEASALLSRRQLQHLPELVPDGVALRHLPSRQGGRSSALEGLGDVDDGEHSHCWRYMGGQRLDGAILSAGERRGALEGPAAPARGRPCVNFAGPTQARPTQPASDGRKPLTRQRQFSVGWVGVRNSIN